MLTTIVLEGGLGNRMRVAAAAEEAARRTGIRLRILWLQQWGMRCSFSSLFLPPEDTAAELRDARGWERLVYTRARPANLWYPRALQRLLHPRIILSPRIWYLLQDHFDFDAWLSKPGGLMMAYRDFGPYEDQTLRRLFRPQPVVQRMVEDCRQQFSDHTIGCHIRRTDNQQSIIESPLEHFLSVIDRELDGYATTRVFLATDDEPTKRTLRQRYGAHRIITLPGAATRETTDGIRQALAEMFTLAATTHIYGSAGSTFSEIAARLGGIPLTV